MDNPYIVHSFMENSIGLKRVSTWQFQSHDSVKMTRNVFDIF